MPLPHVPAVRPVRRPGQRALRAVLSCVTLSAVALVATAPPTASAADSSTRAARAGNLLTKDTAAFDTSTGYWRGSTEARLTIVKSPTLHGPGALSVKNTSSGAATLLGWAGGETAKRITATAGFRYVGHANVRAATTGRAVKPQLAFLNSQGVEIDRVYGQPHTSNTSGWTTTVDVVGLAPPNTAYITFGLSFAGVAPAEVHYVDLASLTEARGGSARVVGPLRTSGNRILDANGQQVILRGVNRAGLEKNTIKPPDAHEIQKAKDWGANVVRIPLGYHYWLSSFCSYDPGYIARVDDAVRLVTERGMVAMLNLHHSATTSCGQYGLVPGAAASPAITFWKQVAARYKANPLVTFDLYNEPHHLTEDIWRNGGAVTWQGVTYQVAGMQQMYDAVRSTGAKNLVMASGNSWANLWPKSGPLSGTNIVYAIHLYTCPEVAPPDCSSAAPYDPVPWLKPWLEPSTKYPVMITEFGWPNPQDGKYIRNLIAYVEQQRWGWSAYTWNNETWGKFTLIANAGPGMSYQPRPVGMPVLAAYPGSAPG